MRFSTRLRNNRANQIEITLDTAPKLQLFTGALPAAIGDDDSGTKLVDTALPSDWLTAASNGQKTKNGTWTLTGIATGNARHFRLKHAGDSGCDVDGLCGQNWASQVYPLNQHVVNDSGKVYVCTTAGTSAGSGGPTGTGSGISDGSCVWSYVGMADMVLDNTQIANGQEVTVNSFQITEGNA
jgi:hypothetical protein